jgi:hypothetical protein
MRKYDIVENGEGFEVKDGEKFRLECGDCGCVRQVGVAIEENGSIGIALQVDEKETRARRKLPETKAKIQDIAEGI